MKKLILTEKQLDRLVSYLFEDDSDKDKKLKILEELRTEFNNALKEMSTCDDLILMFSDEKEKNKSIVVLRSMTLYDNGLKLKAIKIFGPQNSIQKNGVYQVHFKDFFNIGGDGAWLKLYFLTETGEEGETEITPVGVKDFKIYKIITNSNNCKKDTAAPEKIFAELDDTWKKAVDKLMQRTQYTPGLFGMNNIFFFPKGFAAMDDILKKYGLSVKKKDVGEKVTFKVLSKPKTKSILRQGATIEGRIDHKNNIELNKLYLEVSNDGKIEEGAELEVSVYSTTTKSRAFLEKLNIEIIAVKRSNDSNPERMMDDLEIELSDKKNELKDKLNKKEEITKEFLNDIYNTYIEFKNLADKYGNIEKRNWASDIKKMLDKIKKMYNF